MSEVALDPANPEHFSILAARLVEFADDNGVSERTLDLHRFLMITSTLVVAIVLGVCSISSVDTQAGQVTFASAGWLSLAMLVLISYCALNYFIHYWRDRTAYGFRKARALYEGRMSELAASAAGHFHAIRSGGLTMDEVATEADIGHAKNAVLKAVATRLNTSSRLLFIVYGVIPAIMVGVSLISLVTQAPWNFSALPQNCSHP